MEERGHLLNACVCGSLMKYTNLAKGWRPRVFTLSGGVLRYYKLAGPSRVDILTLLENLRASHEEVKLLGAAILVLEANAKSDGRVPGVVLTPPTGEMHLQVSSVKASASDSRKLYIHSGTKTIYLRTEALEDRTQWMQYLSAAKQTACSRSTVESVGVDNSALGTPEQQRSEAAAFAALRGAVVQRMQEEGASPGLVGYVADVLEEQHRGHVEALAQDTARRQQLTAYLEVLEENKNSLETQIVATQADRAAPLNHAAVSTSLSSSRNHWPRVDLDAGSDAAHDTDEGVDEQDSEDDEFFDAPEDLEVGAAHRKRAAPPAAEGSGREGASEPAAAQEHNGDSWRHPAWLESEPSVSRRTGLPTPKQKEKSVSLWSILKEVVGKDLTRICLPVYFNEPISALEKAGEEMEYCSLLDSAALAAHGSLERLMLVSAFAISGYAGTEGRTAKPFNPLLGETYELVHKEKAFRFISEKVVHHPTVFATHGEGRGWAVDADGEVKSKFWGRSIELIPLGVCQVTFHDGDLYTWQKVTTNILNLIVGKILIDNAGVMKVHCTATGNTAKIKFKAKTFMDKNPHQVIGHVETATGKLPGVYIEGKWDEALATDLGDGTGRRLLWQKAPPAENPTRYNLTQFCMQLNEITPGLKELLAPTDSRLRPDQALTEAGVWDEANIEKQRLEKKQRAARKAAERGEVLRPRWFTEVAGVERGKDLRLSFKYSGGYFETRQQPGGFAGAGCRDIFGPDQATPLASPGP